MSVLSILLHPAVLAVLAGVLTFVFMKLDCKVSAEDKKVSTYCKNIALVSALVGAVAYLVTSYAPFGSKRGGAGTTGGGHSSIILEDVALGEPDF